MDDYDVFNYNDVIRCTCPNCGEEIEIELNNPVCLCSLCNCLAGDCICNDCNLKEECNKPCEREYK